MGTTAPERNSVRERARLVRRARAIWISAEERCRRQADRPPACTFRARATAAPTTTAEILKQPGVDAPATLRMQKTGERKTRERNRDRSTIARLDVGVWGSTATITTQQLRRLATSFAAASQ